MMLGDAPVMPTIPASNMERAKKFYSETLGLKLKEESGGGFTYECGGGTMLFLYESAGAGTSQATYAGWETKDLAATMSELKSKGVKFEEYDMPGLKTTGGVAELGGWKSAWFKDSEGNILNIGQKV